jgi:tetratricopeptide (TPR) repeat protein
VAAEIIRRGAFSGRPTSEQEEVLGEQVERGYSVFFGGQLSYDQIMAQLRPLLAVWNGSNPDLKAWEQVEGQLEPSFRSGVAYLFGRRHLRLGKWDQAEVLFHCALANASRDSRLHRLVQTEVASLEAVQLNNASWAVVCQPGAEKATYNQCLEKAQRACLLVPDNGLYLNTLGVAQYRLGQYPSAVDTLMRSDKLNERRFQGSFPADLAFLAMAQHQLGRRQEAQATLTRLRQVAKQPRWAREPNTQGFLREAESLLKPAKP